MNAKMHDEPRSNLWNVIIKKSFCFIQASSK
jgi:hypothetical protein